MAGIPTEGQVAAAPPRKVRHHPRLDQAKRSWYFFRRNTLALVGLAILVAIALFASYAATQPIAWYKMTTECTADYGPDNSHSGWNNSSTGSHGPYDPEACAGFPLVCTYEVTPPPNANQFCGGQWYKSTSYKTEDFPAMVAPTWTLKPLSMGPLPLGSMATIGGIDVQQIYNIWDVLLRGSDWSLMFSVGIVGVGAFVGLLVGSVAGFFGGIIDDVLMRLVDIFLSIPVILFVVVVVLVATLDVHSVFGLSQANTKLLMLVLGFAAVWWPFYARLVRGQVLVVREQKFVEAARASGASKGRILTRHIIPNSVYPIFIQFSLDVGTVPLLIGSLAYLGFANELFPTTYFPEWGNLTQLGVSQISSILQTCTDPSGCLIPWWQLFFPGFALFLFAISVNLLSDGLRDAFDPRMRR